MCEISHITNKKDNNAKTVIKDSLYNNDIQDTSSKNEILSLETRLFQTSDFFFLV